MTLVISKGITLAKANNGIVDPDAIIYINNVEKADGENLEYDTAKAIHDFVVGCKADGIWNAIKASCILAGARTLTGALVPLVGTAPTNVGGLFVSGDYNRKTGLVGNGSTKYLNSNRNNNADPRNSVHHAVYVTSGASGQTFTAPLGIFTANGTMQLASGAARNRSGTINGGYSDAVDPSFVGTSRNNSADFILRINGTNNTAVRTSSAPISVNIGILGTTAGLYSTARLAFYSIGESLDLALLDARVTTLINAFAAAIP
jgi:hypothetical protein